MSTVGMNAGRMNAGRMRAGKTSAGRMSAGRMSAGRMSAGRTSNGRTSNGRMNAIIICGGIIEDYTYFKRFLENADYVICADGGARHVKMLNVVPDVLLGDFDSISGSDYDFLKQRTNVETYPVEKNETDSEIAVELALKKGYRNIIILGGTGGRLDHTVANMLLLKRIHDAGAEGMLVNEKNQVYYVTSAITLEREEGFKVSLIPLGQKACGITTGGLYYPLSGEDIESGSTRGISNEFIADTAEITVEKGALLVIKSKD
jgi:thiamine pyrophosphokinase